VVLTLAAWVAWATFAAAVVVEFVAGIRGIQAPRIAFAGPFQRSARTLVAGVLLMLSLLQSAGPSYASVPRATAATVTPASFAHESPQPGHVIEVTIASARTTYDASSSDESAPTNDPQDAAPVIEVERGDSPWSLAEAHLGDGLRWRELYEINRGLPQPDGPSWTNPELIVPGWQLRLPGAPQNPALQSPVETTDAAEVVHVVQRGDTLLLDRRPLPRRPISLPRAVRGQRRSRATRRQAAHGPRPHRRGLEPRHPHSAGIRNGGARDRSRRAC
ncbi:MAG: LysM peptidoglycan-binding domain-containing protein, partial [Microthrixaceae bacterium]